MASAADGPAGAQLFAVAFMASDVMAPVRLERENALFQAAAVGMVWLLCILYPHAAERWARVVARRETRTVPAPAA